MGEIKKAPLVKLFVGMLYPSKSWFEWALDRLQERFGEIDLISDEWDFVWTDYYKDISPHLKRRFVSFSHLYSLEGLYKAKIISNRIEELSGSDDKSRNVNLDPGYIDGARLVLYSTKDHAHRIYIAEGIYAEVTLRFIKGSFVDFDYTYFDYRSSEYKQFFVRVRELYLKQKRQHKDGGVFL